MEKKLLEEIKRINTINNGGKLLNEGIPGVVADFWTDILRKVSGKADDVSVSVSDITPTFNKIIDDIDVPENTLDDLTEIINNPNHWDTMSEVAKRNVMKVYAEIDEIATPIYEAILKNTDKAEIDFAVKIREMRVNNPGIAYDDAVDAIFKGTPQEGMGPIVAKKSKNIYNAYVAKMVRISKTAKILQRFGYTRNLGRLVELLSQRMKNMDELIIDIKEVMNRSFSSVDDTKRFRIDLENKLLALEKLKDGGAQAAVDDILVHFKELKKSGKISDGDYNSVKKHFENITKGVKNKDGTYSPNRVWEEIIEPLNEDLDKELNGWKSFFNRAIKTSPFKIVRNPKNGKLGVRMQNPVRLVNFVVFQSTQTGKDILKRYITSRNGKYFFNKIPINDLTKTALQTYLRAILFKAMLPSLLPLAYSIIYKTSDYLKDDTFVDWPSDEFIKEIGIKMDEAWKTVIDEDGFFTIDSELDTWTYNDLIPALSTYIDDALTELGEYIFSREPEDIVVPDTPTTDSDSTVTEPTLFDKVVNATNVLPQGLKDAVPDEHEDRIERVNGVWIFHDKSGTDYKLKKGKGLKDNATEYPFEDESKRNNLQDDVWYLLFDEKGNGKYDPLILSVTLEENMKRKGLGILLEQVNTGRGQVDGSGSNSGSGSNTTDVKTQETKRKRQLEDQMLAMFEKIEINDRDSERNMIDKLTDSDKSVIVKDSFDALINHYGGILKIKDELVDDTVVGNSVNYLIKDRKMEPFKIVYKSPLKLDAKIMESKGLESILYEQGVTVSYNTIYINYPDGSEDLDKIEFIRGGKSEKIALDNYNKRFYPDQKVDDSQATPPSERDKNTTEVSEVRPEVRPEDAMGIKTPKMMKKQMNNEKS